jgi:hypothetical protein
MAREGIKLLKPRRLIRQFIGEKRERKRMVK